MHFVIYLFHYVIARTIYDGARTLGVSPVVMFIIAVVCLVVLRYAARGIAKPFRGA